jgi:hypothetical protein
VALVRGRRRSGHLWLSTTADRAEAADGPSGGWRQDEQALPSLNGSPHHVCSERLANTVLLVTESTSGSSAQALSEPAFPGGHAGSERQ